jgi:hypothetical protein
MRDTRWNDPFAPEPTPWGWVAFWVFVFIAIAGLVTA